MGAPLPGIDDPLPLKRSRFYRTLQGIITFSSYWRLPGFWYVETDGLSLTGTPKYSLIFSPAPKPANALPRMISKTELAFCAVMYVTFPPMAIIREATRTILI